MLDEGALRRSERCLDVAARGREKCMRPRCRREGPRPAQALTVFLELRRQFVRVIELAECDVRLDCVGMNRVGGPLAEACVADQLRQRGEVLARFGEFPGCEVEVAERPQVVRQPDRRADRAGVVGARLQDAKRVVHAAEMHCDDPGRIPLVAELSSELAVEDGEFGRVGVRLREPSGASLELGQLKEAACSRAHAIELARQLEQLEQDRPGAGELPRVQ